MIRTFIPGSKWLYFKIYTGIISSDNILINYLLPIVSSLRKKNIIEKYFFIRYTDPHYHIRLRFKLFNSNDYGYIFHKFYQIINPAIKNNLIWKIQCDTYQRELERYNAKIINDVETIFYADSECTLKFTKQYSIKYNFDKIRWHFAICSINDFLNNCGYKLHQKKRLLNLLSENMHQEFSMNSSKSLVQLDKMYRKEKQDIDDLISGIDNKFHLLFSQRRLKQEKALIKIIQTTSLSDYLLSNILHMNINRIFKSKNRICELVLYHFLAQYYSSEIAKSSK